MIRRPGVVARSWGRWNPIGLLPAVLALFFAAAACTSGGGRPKPTSIDAAKAFLHIAKSPTFSAHYTITGTITAGGQTATVSGQGAFKGPDSEETDTIAMGATNEIEQSVTSAGTDYGKHGDGPWLKEPNGHLDALLTRLTTVQDVGVETKDGQRLHHLRPPAGFAIEPSDLGLQNETISNLQGSVDFYAQSDGTPRILTITASWQQTVQGQPESVAATGNYTLSAIGKPLTIPTPSEVWTAYSSKPIRYSIAYPPEWEVKPQSGDIQTPRGNDRFSGPSGQFVLVFSEKIPKGTTLNEVTAGEITANLHDLGKRPEANEAIQFGGERSRLLTYHFSSHGSPLYGLIAVSVHGIGRYDVGWFSHAGSEASDKARFQEFLASFSFTD